MKNVKDWLREFHLSKKLIILIFIFNLLILLLHLFRSSFVLIDNVTILLMVLVLLTPFASHIKKIKWGDFEAEFQREIEKLKEDVKVVDENRSKSKPSVKADSIANELSELADKDSVLAIAKLRIEIELRLKRLFIFSEKGSSYSIRTMTQTLAATGVINNNLRNVILDITSILNRVVHGDEIPTESNINSILEAGIEILMELDGVFYDKVIKPKSKKAISKKEVEGYMDAVYEVTSVVPMIKKPYINKRILNQEQLDLFLDGYDEYAEFLVSIEKV